MHILVPIELDAPLFPILQCRYTGESRSRQQSVEECLPVQLAQKLFRDVDARRSVWREETRGVVVIAGPVAWELVAVVNIIIRGLMTTALRHTFCAGEIPDLDLDLGGKERK